MKLCLDRVPIDFFCMKNGFDDLLVPFINDVFLFHLREILELDESSLEPVTLISKFLSALVFDFSLLLVSSLP